MVVVVSLRSFLNCGGLTCNDQHSAWFDKKKDDKYYRENDQWDGSDDKPRHHESVVFLQIKLCGISLFYRL